ncbi:MAG TPA: PhoH family protein [Thermodesulfovibrionales bacterium]|nr:PhoH family protein [Thermodesulfovibrionales bacterium]
MQQAECLRPLCSDGGSPDVPVPDQTVEKRLKKKIFVLDTNVLIHDPSSLFRFGTHDVVIPFVVLEELDRLKKGHGEKAVSARSALRIIDRLTEKGPLMKGIAMETGGLLSIGITLSSVPTAFMDGVTEDNAIIKTALGVVEQQQTDGRGNMVPVTLVSKDTTVRIKAEACGLHAEDYESDKTTIFQKYGRVLEESDYTNGIHSIRYVKSGEEVFRLQGCSAHTKIKNGKSLEGIAPKNIEQRCAIDALINPDIEVVALTGSAGTGKTLLALAAGIHQTTKKSPLYEQVVVARPVVPMGNDIGYLPGDVNEKLTPWMQPIFDSLEVIVNTPKGHIKDDRSTAQYRSFQYLIDAGVLQIEALTYIRGRSLPQRYFIVDEAQNLRPVDVKTIITRCGEGTKIVFTGDLNQIDTPYLDAKSNGLAYLISRFIDEENFCYLNLHSSVRSRLAEQGARLL